MRRAGRSKSEPIASGSQALCSGSLAEWPMDRRRSIIDREGRHRRLHGLLAHFFAESRATRCLAALAGSSRSRNRRRRGARGPASHRHQRLRGRDRRLDDREHLCRGADSQTIYPFLTKLVPSALNDDVIFCATALTEFAGYRKAALKSARWRSCRLSGTSQRLGAARRIAGPRLDRRGRADRGLARAGSRRLDRVRGPAAQSWRLEPSLSALRASFAFPRGYLIPGDRVPPLHAAVRRLLLRRSCRRRVAGRGRPMKERRRTACRSASLGACA